MSAPGEEGADSADEQRDAMHLTEGGASQQQVFGKRDREFEAAQCVPEHLPPGELGGIVLLHSAKRA